MMIRVPGSVGVTLALAAIVAGCGTTPGGGSGGSLSGTVALELLNPNLALTLNRGQLFWDGTLVDDVSLTPPNALLGLGGSITTSPGTHTLSFKVISQTSSPITYTIGGDVGVSDLATGVSQGFNIPSQNMSVTTGATVNFTVVFH